MTTLPPSSVKKFGETTIEKKAYNLAESFVKYMPIPNDRNRLGFNIYRNLVGEGDSPETIIKTGKYKLDGISKPEFIKLFTSELEKLKV